MGETGEGGEPEQGTQMFSEEEVERRVSEAREEARRSVLAETEEVRAQATRHAQELAEARPLAEAAGQYRRLLNETIDEEVGRWPEEVRALDPGPERLEERLTWMVSARALAERLTARPRAAETEAGAGNRPGAQAAEGKEGEQRRPYRFQNAGDVTW